MLRRRTLFALAAAAGSSLIAPMRRVTLADATPPPPVAGLDAVLQAALDDGLPGIALRVEQGADVVYSGVAGVADIEDRTPLQAADRFRIYSITKTFTVIVILQLVDESIVHGDQLLKGELIDLSASNLSWVWMAGGWSRRPRMWPDARAVFSGERLSPASFTEMFTFVAEPGRSGFGSRRLLGS